MEQKGDMDDLVQKNRRFQFPRKQQATGNPEDLLNKWQRKLISSDEKIITVTRPVLMAYFIAIWPIISLAIFGVSIFVQFFPSNVVFLILFALVATLIIVMLHKIKAAKGVYGFVFIVTAIWMGWILTHGSFILQLTLYLVIFNALGFLYRWYSWFNTRFILTSRNVIHCTRPFIQKRVRSFKRSTIVDVDFTQYPVIEEPFGVGDLKIEKINGSKDTIEDVPEILEIVRELKKDIQNGK